MKNFKDKTVSSPQHEGKVTKQDEGGVYVEVNGQEEYIMFGEITKVNGKKTFLNEDGNEVEKIDLTPTWSDALQIYLRAILDGNGKGRAAALEEVNKMATIADAYVEQNTPLKRSEIKEYLDDQDMVFNENDSRAGDGHIGNLRRKSYGKGEHLVTIYKNTFFIFSDEFSLNERNLKLIQSIQKQFKELTMDDNNKVLTNVFED